jgi:hypothetical protein
MSYLGNEPQFSQYPSKFFNGNGTAQTVSLDYAPPNAAAVLVFIDGVRQDTSAYTLSGTNLTFTGSVPSGTNNVEVVHMGLIGTVDVGVPSDGTVTNAKMAANSIDSDQYVDGSIDNAHLAANSVDSDQYVDGSIDNAHLADNAVDSAEIVAGAVDSAHLASTVNLTGKTVTIPDGFTLGSTAVTATGTELNTIADQYGYMTIWVDAGAMVSTTTAGADANTNEYGTNDVNWDYLAFDTGGTEEQAQFKIVMPEQWNLGTIKAKFYWSSASGSTAGDTVEWGLKGRALANDDAIDSAFGTEQVITDTVLAGTNGDVHITAATPAITIGNTPALNDICAFEVHRNTDGTDNMAEDAWLFGILIQITTTSTIAAW